MQENVNKKIVLKSACQRDFVRRINV